MRADRFLSVAGATVRAMTTLTLDWTEQLSEQLEWHWTRQLRPRFAGLSDDEYFWEPAQPAWNVRPRTGEGQPGTGPFTVNFSFPEPDPRRSPPIAWRLAHIIVGVLGAGWPRTSAAHRSTMGASPTQARPLRRCPAGRRLRGLDGGRPRSRRGGARAAVRAGGGPVLRVPDGRARAAHPPGGDPSRGGGGAAARPVPGAAADPARPRRAARPAAQSGASPPEVVPAGRAALVRPPVDEHRRSLPSARRYRPDLDPPERQ